MCSNYDAFFVLKYALHMYVSCSIIKREFNFRKPTTSNWFARIKLIILMLKIQFGLINQLLKESMKLWQILRKTNTQTIMTLLRLKSSNSYESNLVRRMYKQFIINQFKLFIKLFITSVFNLVKWLIINAFLEYRIFAKP